MPPRISTSGTAIAPCCRRARSVARTSSCFYSNTPTVHQEGIEPTISKKFQVPYHPTASTDLDYTPRTAGPISPTTRLPRWQQTPPRLTLPLKLRRGKELNVKCNDDPKKLDNMYSKLLVAGQSLSPGTNPASMLTEETKWLAITHKSFDQGKRGFNERLSLLGRRLVESETSMALTANALTSGSANAEADEHGRIPYQHPQLNGIETLVENTVESKLTKFAIFALANKYGIPAVLRWKPKLPGDPEKCGLDTIAGQALYAIVGAIALERGGNEAKILIRERILKPLKVINI